VKLDIEITLGKNGMVGVSGGLSFLHDTPGGNKSAGFIQWNKFSFI
jgi:hypothetical protein